ncbi:hypothetical protein B0I35DRAFT_481186 [Stachybotrys elegans]|uniref:Uncharacterized protein n=1 Tax=Stachybotrys elegans TaxID=80388 RepID=A0A8K0WNQ9_9HYPO|nr:hypothetical protein B0I35DRAFT_481186 [Stachybotrys elegans]
MEIFPADVLVMNLSTTTSSFFTQTVMAARACPGDDHCPAGSEAERVAALEEYFGIILDPEEQQAILGTASELKSVAAVGR